MTGWGESAYNVSVGGTDYEDTYNAAEGGASVSTYWESTNTPASGSAKSYVPEIPWNDSCASWLITHLEGYAATYGNDRLLQQHHGYHERRVSLNGRGKRRSERLCHRYVGQFGQALVDGTCAGYAKPSWQAGIFGNPADGVRDVPDVSLFAGNGIWGHYAVVCFSDTSNGGISCGGAPKHLGRLWRHVRRHSHDGRDSGPRESEDGFQAG